MGFLQRVSTVASPPLMQAMSSAEYAQAFWNGGDLPSHWPTVTGEVGEATALALSYVYCAVSIQADDFGTAACQMFRDLGDDRKERVKFSDPGIGLLAYKLRYKPNIWQTAKSFWSTLIWQLQLRHACYAEIVYRPGVNGFVDQIIPRHPDRVRQEVLPDGSLRFKLTEPGGSSRYITQDEMFVVRNLSCDGLNAVSRLGYGSRALASALALQEFTLNYFKKGATAALLASYKADLGEEEEKQLHGSISRYLSGVENAGGLMLVPADIDVKTLGVEPQKAELTGLKNLSGRDIARLWKMPPSWLGIQDSQSYASQIQDAQNYVNRVQKPLAREFEDTIFNELILSQQCYAKFNLDYLLRGNTLERMQAYETAIRARVMRPSEARVLEDWSPDPALDKLSESDNQPGKSGAVPQQSPSQPSNRAMLRGMLAVHDNAVRCLRRERAAVEKLAKKHAADVEGWQSGLKDFYADHAGFVAQTMRLPIDQARDYAAQHGAQFEAHGMRLIDGENGDHWERFEADELSALAMDSERMAA